MSEDFLIRHCSPTLAGIKTGSLFSCGCPCKKQLTKDLSGFNRKLAPKGIRVLPLKVSGGFHSPFMQNAQAGLAEALKSAPLAAPRIPLYANQTAQPYSLETARECLAGQVAHPVRWQQTIENLIAAGAESFLELGPGATLAGLGKRIAPDHAFLNAEDMAGIQAAAQALL